MDIGIAADTKMNSTEWQAASRRAIATKDPVCVICHKYIDIELPRKNPDTGEWNALSVEVDHIIPRVRGGPIYEQSNLQLTHSVCNRKKGARMDSDYEANAVINPFPHSNNW